MNENKLTLTASGRVDRLAEWRFRLALWSIGATSYLALSALLIWLLPFSRFLQFTVLGHTLGDINVDPELRWRALARQSVFGRYWLPMRKYLNAPDLSPAIMEQEYRKLKEALLTEVESQVSKKSF